MLFEVQETRIPQHLQFQGFNPRDAFIDVVVRAVGEYSGRVWAWLAVIIVHDRKYIRSIRHLAEIAGRSTGRGRWM
jgi:hypothetical protein